MAEKHTVTCDQCMEDLSFSTERLLLISPKSKVTNYHFCNGDCLEKWINGLNKEKLSKWEYAA